MNTETDTIAAIASAPGRGGIGVIRISGPGALRIGQSLTGRSQFTPRMMHLCELHDASGQLLDQAMAVAFPAPHSFTGEDVVELHGHGGPVVLDLVLRETLQLGARLAEPGEYSLRAYLNDKIDLAQAEAIADLIDSGTNASARAAAATLKGAFSDAVTQLKEQLIQLRLFVEAAIDFPEEEIDFLADDRIGLQLQALIDAVQSLLGGAQQGVLVREGIKIVLVGQPNAGKSSLLNRLAGEERAIVSAQPGTTRDIIQVQLDLDGLLVEVLDTAGLRDAQDDVEIEGVARARAAQAAADITVLVVDAAGPLGGYSDLDLLDVHQLRAQPEQPTADADTVVAPNTLDSPDARAQQKHPRAESTILVARNKVDLLDSPGRVGSEALAVSATTGEGIDGLIRALKAAAGWQDGATGQFTARRRHLVGLEQTMQSLRDAEAALQGGADGELMAEDLKRAQTFLGELVGDVCPDELLGRIFSSFCIGK